VPTYKNVTLSRQSINGKIVESGQEVCSFGYLDERGVQLIHVSDKPFYNPVVLSEKIEKSCTVEIPKKDNLGKFIDKFSVHFCLENGEAEVLFNSFENKPSLKLYPGCKWNLRCFERQIDKLVIVGSKNFILWIIVEKLS